MIKLILIVLVLSVNLNSSDWYFSGKILPAELSKLELINKDYCYATIRKGLVINIYITTDQGESWNLKSAHNNLDSDPLLLRIWDTDMPDSNHLYYSYNDDYGYIKRSKNGGKSFENIFIEVNSNLRDIQMIDSLKGIIHKHQVFYYTQDGFDTFEKITYKSEFALEPLEFINDSIIELLSHRTGIYNFNLKTKELIKVSSFSFDSTIKYNNEIDAIDKKSKGIIYICGQRLTGITDTAYDIIFKSKDFGKTWIKQLDTLVLPKHGLQDIAFFDDLNGIVVGQFGKILVTNDGGENWRYEELPEEMLDEKPAVMHVLWAGKSPIIATLGGSVYLYEGDFFKFEKEEKFTISGRVTLDGIGKEDIIISNGSNTVTTNSKGEYEFVDLVGASYTISPNTTEYNYSPDNYIIELNKDTNNLDFNLSPITSVETKINSPYIYPNPANETITISGIEQGKLEIYNSIGQLLIQSEIQGNSTINTSNLQTGIYIIKVESKSVVKFEKLLINK